MRQSLSSIQLAAQAVLFYSRYTKPPKPTKTFFSRDTSASMLRPAYQQRGSTTNLRSGAPPRALEGKLAIITGGSRGIGAAIARNLASKGASVVINYTSDTSKEIAANLSSELESTHEINALPVQADMGDPSGPAHLIATAKNHFSHPKTGKFQIDILINNAGIAGVQPLGPITPEPFNKMYAVNVLGPLLVVQEALPYLPTDRSGRIVNMSSVASSVGIPNSSIYAGTKGALEAMTRVWCRELAERATVNVVNPGPVDTELYPVDNEEFVNDLKHLVAQTPLQRAREGIDEERFIKRAEKEGGRPGYTHEVAGVVAMLCTEDAGWCTGSVICANGGMKFSF